MSETHTKLSRRSGVPPEIKEQLKAEGKWESFLAYRDQLKSEGYKPKQAREAAILEFTQNEEVPVSCSGPAAESAPLAGLTPLVSSSPPEYKTAAGSLASVPSGSVNLADFEGKSSGEADIIRWVARFMEIEDVSPSDCPDPIAWNMLVHCRKFPAAKNEFWRNTYPKLLPSKSQLEEVKSDDYDGKSMVEVIEQIKGIRDGVDKIAGKSE